MKFVTILATLLVSVSSFARTPIMRLSHTMHEVQINGEQTAYQAAVELDFFEQQITVEILDGNDVVRSFSAPITKRESVCGSAVYTAYRNQLPADGYEVAIEVADHSYRTCFDIPEGLVVVEMNTTAGWTLEKTSYRLIKH